MWETVTFSSTHCVYTYTPGVQTLDAILSSSLMAACIAWVLVLLSTWLVIGEMLIQGWILPMISRVFFGMLRTCIQNTYLRDLRSFLNRCLKKPKQSFHRYIC